MGGDGLAQRRHAPDHSAAVLVLKEIEGYDTEIACCRDQ